MLRYASTRLRKDPAVVHAAVAQTGLAMRWISSECSLLGDRSFLRSAALQDWRTLEHASAEVLNDPAFFMSLPTNACHGEQLEWAGRAVREHRTAVLHCLQSNLEASGLGLQWVSEPLSDDRQVVMAAVCSDGRALQFASSRLRRDRTIVMEAVRNRDVASWNLCTPSPPPTLPLCASPLLFSSNILVLPVGVGRSR